MQGIGAAMLQTLAVGGIGGLIVELLLAERVAGLRLVHLRKQWASGRGRVIRCREFLVRGDARGGRLLGAAVFQDL